MLSAPPWRSVRGGATGQVRSHRFEVGDAQGFPVGCVGPFEGGVILSNEAQKCTRCTAVLFDGLTEPRSRGEQLAPQLPRPGSRGQGVSVRPRRSPTTEAVPLLAAPDFRV